MIDLDGTEVGVGLGLSRRPNGFPKRAARSRADLQSIPIQVLARCDGPVQSQLARPMALVYRQDESLFRRQKRFFGLGGSCGDEQQGQRNNAKKKSKVLPDSEELTHL